MTAPVPPQRRELDSQAAALLAARTAVDKHAEHVVVMDLRSLSTITDFFVLCTAGSGPHVNALKDHLEAALEQGGCPVHHVEGLGHAGAIAQPAAHTRQLQWVLMDCGDVVVHLLNEHARVFYRLEDLWADAPRIPIPSA